MAFCPQELQRNSLHLLALYGGDTIIGCQLDNIVGCEGGTSRTSHTGE